MIVFNTQEEFENAVVEALRSRVAVGVTVSKRSEWYGENEATKVEVSLFDRNGGDDIDRGSDYA